MASYTAGEVVTMIGALGVLIAAFGAIIVNIITALRTTRAVEANASKTDGLVVAVEKVHDATNSNLSAVKAELTAARTQITSLVALVGDLRAERGKAEVLAALNTPAPRQGAEERRGETILDQLQPQIDNIETTVEQVDATVNPRRI